MLQRTLDIIFKRSLQSEFPDDFKLKHTDLKKVVSFKKISNDEFNPIENSKIFSFNENGQLYEFNKENKVFTFLYFVKKINFLNQFYF